MPDKVYISKITLPISGENVTFNFMDAVAQQRLAGGLQFDVVYDGGVPTVADIPAGVVVPYGGQDYTGTLAANEAEPLTFYLVRTAHTVTGDIYAEYVPIAQGNTTVWEKIGDVQYDFSSLKALAYKDAITLEKGSGHDVLGADTNLVAEASAVTFTTAHSTDQVLGADTTITAAASEVTVSGASRDKILGASTTLKAAASDIVWNTNAGDGNVQTDDTALGANATFTTTVTPTNKYLKATATGMSIASDGNEAQALTGIGTNSTAEFYTQVDPETKYLETASVYGTDGTESVSQVSNITTGYLTTASVPHVSNVGAADTWEFTYDSSDNELIIGGANGTALSLAGTNDTVATGAVQSSATGAGDAIVTGMTVTPVTAAKKASTATTVATGSLSTTVDGAAVVYDLDTAKDNAVTALGTQSKQAVVTGVVVTDPTIALTLEDNTSEGAASVSTQISAANISTTVATPDQVTAITGLADAKAEGQVISFNNKVELNAFTDLGTATAAGQAITLGTNDLVTVYTALGSAQAAAQTISVDDTAPDTVKVAEYADLDISVS